MPCGRRAPTGGDGSAATGEAPPQAMSLRARRMLPRGNAPLAGFRGRIVLHFSTSTRLISRKQVTRILSGKFLASIFHLLFLLPFVAKPSCAGARPRKREARRIARARLEPSPCRSGSRLRLARRQVYASTLWVAPLLPTRKPPTRYTKAHESDHCRAF